MHPPIPFTDSASYWERRYALGRDSGAGSYFKAEILNDFVAERSIHSVIEFGCGDGNQLSLACYPVYLGLDVSQRAIDQCRLRFSGDPSKSFKHLAEYAGERAELALSLDVIFHLVEDEVYLDYMQRLFSAAGRYVAIYSSNRREQSPGDPPHLRHRRFSDWIDQNRPEWRLLQHIPNRYPFENGAGSYADFFFYESPLSR